MLCLFRYRISFWMFRCMVSLATDGINICIITSGKYIYVTRKIIYIYIYIYISKFLIRCLEKNDDFSSL